MQVDQQHRLTLRLIGLVGPVGGCIGCCPRSFFRPLRCVLEAEVDPNTVSRCMSLCLCGGLFLPKIRRTWMLHEAVAGVGATAAAGLLAFGVSCTSGNEE